QRRGSSGALLVLIENLADLVQFLARCFSRRQRTQHQALCRAVECALEKVTGELLLGPFARAAGSIDVSFLLLIALDQAFFGHDLEQLQNRGVLRGAPLLDGFVNVADGTGATAPEHGQDFQLGVSWSGWVFRRHLRRLYYEGLRVSIGKSK